MVSVWGLLSGSRQRLTVCLYAWHVCARRRPSGAALMWVRVCVCVHSDCGYGSRTYNNRTGSKTTCALRARARMCARRGQLYARTRECVCSALLMLHTLYTTSAQVFTCACARTHGFSIVTRTYTHRARSLNTRGRHTCACPPPPPITHMYARQKYTSTNERC